MTTILLAPPLTGRWAAVETLQHRRDRSQPGGEYETINERALDMALSEKRTELDARRLTFDVTRNAKHDLARSGPRRRRAVAQYVNTTARLNDAADDIVDPVDVSGQVVEAHSSLCACALTLAAQKGPSAARFIQAIMDGHTASHAASLAGFSRRSAYRLLDGLRGPLSDLREAA